MLVSIVFDLSYLIVNLSTEINYDYLVFMTMPVAQFQGSQVLPWLHFFRPMWAIIWLINFMLKHDY